jgi:hypothetical protein
MLRQQVLHYEPRTEHLLSRRHHLLQWDLHQHEQRSRELRRVREPLRDRRNMH